MCQQPLLEPRRPLSLPDAANSARQIKGLMAKCSVTRPLRTLPKESAMGTLDELGVQHDLGVENLGDGAVLLGISGDIGEFCVVQVRHAGAQRQSRTADAESLALRFESDGCLSAELGRGKAGALQAKG